MLETFLVIVLFLVYWGLTIWYWIIVYKGRPYKPEQKGFLFYLIFLGISITLLSILMTLTLV